MDKEELAYLAGIIDGEGTISISGNKSQSKNSYAIVMRVYNSNKKLCDWVCDKTKLGKVSISSSSEKWKKLNKNAKVVYQWATFSNGMREVLPKIIPYLIIKKEIAEIAIEWLNKYGNKKLGGKYLSEDDNKWKEDMYQKLKVLNKRGLI